MAKTKIPGEYLKDSVVRFTAKAGENITKGQSVYISGISGEVPVVSLADADDTNKMPAFGLAESTVSTNGSIEVTSNGTLAGIDTSSYTLGDILYISTTAGSLTNDPSGLEASKVQNIGMVQRVHANNGSIKVGGAGRTNATPNLNDGNIFVGNPSNKSVSDAFTDVLNDQAGINSSANATAITIDSSENILIGKSATGGNTAGMQILKGSFFSHVRDDGVVQVLNRKTSDGSILQFEKNNTEFGSIGVATNINIGSGSTRIWFKDDTKSLRPISTAIGNGSDGLISLGEASGGRFKDLHLSGTANVGTVVLPDNGKAIFGAGSDLQIYHDGSNSYINDVGTGSLYIKATNLSLSDAAGEQFLNAYSNGGVVLYHNNNQKLETTSTGVQITGTGTFTGEFLDFSSGSFRIQAASSQTGQLGFNRNPADGAHLGQSGFNRYQINGPFSGSDFLDFQNYNSSGTYLGGFRVEDGAIRAEPKGISEPSYSFDNDTDTGMTRPTGDTLQFVTGGAVRLRINSDGLKFGSDTAAANSLNDYEEGTWNPSFQSDGSTSYHHRVGTYTKVGNLVTAWFHLDIATNGAVSTQSLVIAGLPFAAINTSENYGTIGGMHCNQWSTSSKPDNALISPGQNVASVYKSAGQAGIYVVKHSDIGNGNMVACLTYRAA
jgi:hypothetical protein